MSKLAVIGASYLQEPLIQKAKQRGIETHVFAWQAGDVGEYSADYFYPISIINKEEILQKCLEIGIDGICSIASDLAVVTVNYVAEKLGLVGNSMLCAKVSTNKHYMRKCFEKNGDPSPRSIRVESAEDLKNITLEYPIIVKPVDRSGSRGVAMLENPDDLFYAIERAKEKGFEKCALVEEFVAGEEYSVEYISWNGEHTFLSITQKYTTGAPNFIETGHFQPAMIGGKLLEHIKEVVAHALDSLSIRNGASHAEIKVTSDGSIKIIEIGARMGGDCIGSSLVELTTGVDFVDAVIDIALGVHPIIEKTKNEYAGIRFVFSKEDIDCLNLLKHEHPEILVEDATQEIKDKKITDSSERYGYFLFSSESAELVQKYLPI